MSIDSVADNKVIRTYILSEVNFLYDDARKVIAAKIALILNENFTYGLRGEVDLLHNGIPKKKPVAQHDIIFEGLTEAGQNSNELPEFFYQRIIQEANDKGTIDCYFAETRYYVLKLNLPGSNAQDQNYGDSMVDRDSLQNCPMSF